MRHYFAAAFATARQLTVGVEDAEDACAEAFARAYFRLAQCGQPDRFRGWLLQIVRHQALNVRRYQTLRASVSLDSVPEPAVASENSDDGIDDALRFRVRRALDGLSPVKRAVVRHYDIDGWTHERVAGALGISVFMSRRHLSDARAILREKLGDFYREVADDD